MACVPRGFLLPSSVPRQPSAKAAHTARVPHASSAQCARQSLDSMPARAQKCRLSAPRLPQASTETVYEPLAAAMAAPPSPLAAPRWPVGLPQYTHHEQPMRSAKAQDDRGHGCQRRGPDPLYQPGRGGAHCQLGYSAQKRYACERWPPAQQPLCKRAGSSQVLHAMHAPCDPGAAAASQAQPWRGVGCSTSAWPVNGSHGHTAADAQVQACLSPRASACQLPRRRRAAGVALEPGPVAGVSLLLGHSAAAGLPFSDTDGAALYRLSALEGGAASASMYAGGHQGSEATVQHQPAGVGACSALQSASMQQLLIRERQELLGILFELSRPAAAQPVPQPAQHVFQWDASALRLADAMAIEGTGESDGA